MRRRGADRPRWPDPCALRSAVFAWCVERLRSGVSLTGLRPLPPGNYRRRVRYVARLADWCAPAGMFPRCSARRPYARSSVAGWNFASGRSYPDGRRPGSGPHVRQYEQIVALARLTAHRAPTAAPWPRLPPPDPPAPGRLGARRDLGHPRHRRPRRGSLARACRTEGPSGRPLRRRAGWAHRFGVGHVRARRRPRCRVGCRSSCSVARANGPSSGASSTRPPSRTSPAHGLSVISGKTSPEGAGGVRQVRTLLRRQPLRLRREPGQWKLFRKSRLRQGWGRVGSPPRRTGSVGEAQPVHDPPRVRPGRSNSIDLTGEAGG
jgi:hypothetical protein